MLQGLYAAASGMEAQQNQLDAVANDLANIDTTGYQGEIIGFQDLLYTQGGNSTGTNVATGAGSASSDHRPQRRPGLDPADRPFARRRDPGPAATSRCAGLTARSG